MRQVGSRSKLEPAGLQEYWSSVSDRHLMEADDGLSVICYAGMPAWFNRFYDKYQRKAFEGLLRGEDLRGKRVLDIGTGVGRWAAWYAGEPDNTVVGIDIESQRLRLARRLNPGVQFLEMPMHDLAFPDESFDIVNSVTVLQHVDHETKRAAIAEFNRVLRPGGRVVLFELTSVSDDAPHVYPWEQSTWEAEFSNQGLRVRRTTGNQYTPILRLLKSAYTLTHGSKSRTGIDSMKSGTPETRRLLLALRLAVLASYPVEEVVRFLPKRFGQITGFLLTKPDAPAPLGRHDDSRE